MAKTTVELPAALHRKLRVKAALDGRSMNEIIITALREHLSGFRLEPELLEGAPNGAAKEESHV